MKSFNEKERFCQETFASGGKYWHCFTPGKETPILFVSDEDFIFVMNVIAQSTYEFKVVILAFTIMNNHFHFICSGDESNIEAFFNYLRRRLLKSFPKIKAVTLSIKPLSDLNSLRNAIIYVNRNGYVANPQYTPFSYPWGTGRHYFNPFHKNHTLQEMTIPALRKLFRGRNPGLPGEWMLIDGYISPTSYCKIAYGMSLFRDAHHYFNSICKNIESYVGVAVELDDEEFLTDSELFAEVRKILQEDYLGISIKELSKAQRLDLARTLHYKYHSSKDQIRRILGFSQYEINLLFIH